MEKEPLPCGELLKRLADLYKAKANGSLRGEGVTLSQLNILLYLSGKQEETAPLKSWSGPSAFPRPPLRASLPGWSTKGWWKDP